MSCKYSVTINRARVSMRIRVVLASYPDHSQLFMLHVVPARFSACNIEKVGVAWGRGSS